LVILDSGKAQHLEIGGGFGANIHSLIENYENIRKFLYVHIHPNIYIGTQYLKAFYGTSVKDYSTFRGKDKIAFEDNSDLEIICIPNWSLANLSSSLKIDIFHNASSFTEMPSDVVKHYISCISPSFHLNTHIMLQSYMPYDSRTSMDPQSLPLFFRDFEFNSSVYSNRIISSSKSYGILLNGHHKCSAR